MVKKIFCSFSRRELFWTIIALGICFFIYKFGIITVFNIAFAVFYLTAGLFYSVIVDEPKWFLKNESRLTLFHILAMLFWLPMTVFKFVHSYLSHKA